MAVTECWLNDTVSDGEIYIPGYKVYRKGRGVAMYIDKNIRATRRLDLDNINLEAVWVEIRETANKRLVVGVVYRPPLSLN